MHRDEIASLVERRGGQFHEVIGPRHNVRLDARRCDGSCPTLQTETSISVVRMPSARASSPQH